MHALEFLWEVNKNSIESITIMKYCIDHGKHLLVGN